MISSWPTVPCRLLRSDKTDIFILRSALSRHFGVTPAAIMATQVTVVGGGSNMPDGAWSNGTCGCFNNCSICMLAFCSPCLSFGSTGSELYGGGVWSYILICAFCWPGNCLTWLKHRADIRGRRNIPGSCLGDLCCICCCTSCTLAQEAQEVQGMNTGLYKGQAQNTALVVTQGTSNPGYSGGKVHPGDEKPMDRE